VARPEGCGVTRIVLAKRREREKFNPARAGGTLRLRQPRSAEGWHRQTVCRRLSEEAKCAGAQRLISLAPESLAEQFLGREPIPHDLANRRTS